MLLLLLATLLESVTSLIPEMFRCIVCSYSLFTRINNYFDEIFIRELKPI